MFFSVLFCYVLLWDVLFSYVLLFCRKQEQQPSGGSAAQVWLQRSKGLRAIQQLVEQHSWTTRHQGSSKQSHQEPPRNSSGRFRYYQNKINTSASLRLRYLACTRRRCWLARSRRGRFGRRHRHNSLGGSIFLPVVLLCLQGHTKLQANNAEGVRAHTCTDIQYKQTTFAAALLAGMPVVTISPRCAAGMPRETGAACSRNKQASGQRARQKECALKKKRKTLTTAGLAVDAG
jgi:hypothetical protein